MKQITVFLTIIGLSLALAGCGNGSSSTDPKEAKAPAEGDARTVRVREGQKQFLGVEPVGANGDGETLALPGRVTFRPQAQSAVGAPVSGRVSAVLVRAGETVKAGAALLAIDSADAAAARAALEQAKTRLASAENLYKRQTEMVERGVGLEFERQDAAARLSEARAEHERARQTAALLGAGQGSRFVVRAPGNGVVMAIRVAVGAAVAPGGEPLLELGDPTHLLVVAQVPESDLRRIAVGQQAEVDLPGLTLRLPARVESFSPRVEPDSRRAQLYLALGKRAEGLRAGMLAQVSLRIAGSEALTVPVAAVLIKDGKRRVVYVEQPDGRYEARDVKTGRNRDGRVVILEGLKPGERIVVRGALLLDTQAEQLL